VSVSGFLERLLAARVVLGRVARPHAGVGLSVAGLVRDACLPRGRALCVEWTDSHRLLLKSKRPSPLGDGLGLKNVDSTGSGYITPCASAG
jgi:hypothetical protein